MNSIIILLIAITTSSYVLQDSKMSPTFSTNLLETSTNACPPDYELARRNVIYYISHPHWSNRRNETGTNLISTSDIQHLNQNVDSQVCSYFNSVYANTINEKWPDNSPSYHVSFYKAGDFYFVSIAVAQPSDSDWMSVGLSMLIIFDGSLNRLEGYSF